MNKLLLVIKREYLSRVRKKSFIIMTLLMPFLLTGIFVVPTILAFNNENQSEVAIIDENNFDQLQLQSNRSISFHYLNDIDIKSKISTLLNHYNFILHISKVDSLNAIENNIIIYSKSQVSLSDRTYIENQIENNITVENLLNKGIDPKHIENAQSKVSIKTYVVDELGVNTEGNSEASYGIGMISGFLIYIFIFSYGTMVMRSVIEEKSNRIIEIIVSSIKPFQLMLGKIISIALVGLTQFLLWIILGLILLIVANTFISSGDPNAISNENTELFKQLNSIIGNLPLDQLIISFVLYFLGGYLLYGSLFAAIGSASDQDTDSQQFILPITIPLVLSFILVQLVIDQPHSGLAYILSMIPFTSPIIMMARIPFGVPVHEIILSISLLTLGFIFTTWLAAKIYRVGILMYGKKISYKELWKWINYKE
ncbi:MAG: ABC transporter permease [Flavobacteriales bacterium]